MCLLNPLLTLSLPYPALILPLLPSAIMFLLFFISFLLTINIQTFFLSFNLLCLFIFSPFKKCKIKENKNYFIGKYLCNSLYWNHNSTEVFFFFKNNGQTGKICIFFILFFAKKNHFRKTMSQN